MKKNILTTILILCIVFISGCSIGGEKITCFMSTTEGEIKENIEATAVIDNDIISKISATMTYDNENDMNKICDSLKALPSNELHFSCSGKNIKIKNFDVMLEFSVLNNSKSTFIEKMEQDGFKCN